MRIQQIGGIRPQETQQKQPAKGFGAELAKALDSQLRFSAHAQNRLTQRRIKLSPKQLGALTGAVEQARAKGAKDSLILLDQLAFVVSVQNRTVITAASKQDLKDHIFTNIDSAVIIDEVDRKGPQGH